MFGTRLNVKLDCRDARIVKYHEVINLAIESAINAPYEGHVTSRARVLEPIAMILDCLSEEDWHLDKELIGWTLGDSPVRLPPVLSVEEMILTKNDVCQNL